MQLIELTHRKKVFKLICTGFCPDSKKVGTEEIQSFYEDHDVIHVNAL